MARLLAFRTPGAGVGGALVWMVAAGGWLCNRVWGAIYVDGSIMFIKEINHASPCEGHEDIFQGEGKLPQVPDDIEDAMSNGSSNDEGRAESGLSVPQVLSKVLLVGNSFSNENEVEGKSRIWIAGIDKVGDVLVAHEEPLNIVNGGGESIGLEVRGRHSK